MQHSLDRHNEMRYPTHPPIHSHNSKEQEEARAGAAVMHGLTAARTALSLSLPVFPNPTEVRQESENSVTLLRLIWLRRPRPSTVDRRPPH